MARPSSKRESPAPNGGSPPGIQSLEIGMRVLSGVAAFAAPATLTAIAESIAMDLSTCRRYLVSLLNTGMVRQERETGRYALGDHLLLLGLRALVRNDRVRLSIDRALQLNRDLDQTVIVSVWGDLGPTVVAWFDRSTKLICNSYIGSVYALLSTATGRTFLAYQAEATTLPLLRREFAIGADANLGTEQQRKVRRLREAVRARGMGATDGDVIPGLGALAVPVFDSQGVVAAVIGVIAESPALTGRTGEKVVQALRAAGDDVSRSQAFAPAEERPASYVEWLEAVYGDTLASSDPDAKRAPMRRGALPDSVRLPLP